MQGFTVNNTNLLEERGLGEGFSSPNDLLKFFHFVSENAVKATVVGMKIQTHIYSRKLPESIKIQLLLCHTSQKFQNFPVVTPISHDPLLLSIADISKMGRFPTI